MFGTARSFTLALYDVRVRRLCMRNYSREWAPSSAAETTDADRLGHPQNVTAEADKMRKALILIENTRTNGRSYVEAVRRLRLHPIILAADPALYDYVAAERIEVARVDTTNLDALIGEYSRLGKSFDIAGVTSAAESFYATVGKICRNFNLPGPDPESIEQCCNKAAQRQVLAAAGVPVPGYRSATTAAEVQCVAAEIGLPAVLKPAVGSGSRGVRLCRDARELAEHTDYLLGGKHMWRSSPEVLVEQFVDGPHYIAEIMGDEVIGIGITEYGPPPHFVFRQLTFPAPLTDEQYERAVDVVQRCLRALGLGWGPTNIEFRWTEVGPVVIEVNPRLAGNPDPQLVQLAFDVDLIGEHIKLAIGEQCNLSKRQSRTATARSLIADRDGTLDYIDGIDRAAAIPGVADVKLYVRPGTPIVRNGDYCDRIGYVVAVAPSRSSADTIIQRAVESIDWSISPFSDLHDQEQYTPLYFPD